jgi:sulfate adenylyltransferase subunit 2
MKAIDAISFVAKQSDKAILFHSATGKDSIALLDLMQPHFSHIHCVYMYTVKGLSFVEKYIQYAERKYKNISFMQVPHYTLTYNLRNGYLGVKKMNIKKSFSLADIDERVRHKTGIQWSFYGFKKSDSMNRRLMLNSYGDAPISHSTQKCYPLADWSNAGVLKYIQKNRLINPIKYGAGASGGETPSDIDFLLWVKRHYPQDYELIIKQFPMSEQIVFEHEYKQKQAV